MCIHICTYMCIYPLDGAVLASVGDPRLQATDHQDTHDRSRVAISDDHARRLAGRLGFQLYRRRELAARQPFRDQCIDGQLGASNGPLLRPVVAEQLIGTDLADQVSAVPSNVADQRLRDAGELLAILIGHVHRLELLVDPFRDGFLDVRAIVLIEQHVTHSRAELCCENLAIDGVGSRVSQEGDTKQSRFGNIAVRERHRNVVRHDRWW